jgi:hypothetical protein
MDLFGKKDILFSSLGNGKKDLLFSSSGNTSLERRIGFIEEEPKRI